MMNIIGHRYINLTISGALFVASIVALVIFGLKPGNDFTGGSLLEVKFPGNLPANVEIQTTLASLNLNQITVQPTSNGSVMLKMRNLTEGEHQTVLATLRGKYETKDSKVMEVRFETIGPAVSATLKQRTLWAIILVIVAHIVYIAYAFRRVSKPVASWKYGMVAELAMIHDVVITMGVFAVLGHYFNVEVDIPFVVALLTILGYSVNDTIVIFDRIRENVIRHSVDNFPETINRAINETFGRSINTTLTTLITLTALFVFGGETIKYFSLALLVGIFLGAYSSIFVASPLLVEWFNWDNHKKA
jgi:preprotein translocase subunit SecF